MTLCYHDPTEQPARSPRREQPAEGERLTAQDIAHESDQEHVEHSTRQGDDPRHAEHDGEQPTPPNQPQPLRPLPPEAGPAPRGIGWRVISFPSGGTDRDGRDQRGGYQEGGAVEEDDAGEPEQADQRPADGRTQ